EVPDDVLIGDVNVNLRLSHAIPWDLDVHLVGPDGNDVGLFGDLITALPTPPHTIFTDFDLTLDDEAALPIGSFVSSINGTVMQPDWKYRLHWFDGQRASGTWTLKIWDDTLQTGIPNGGTLFSWGLSICPMAPRPQCPSGTTPKVLYATDFETD